MYKNATFVSLWDGESYSIETSCLIYADGSISEIEQCDQEDLDAVEILDKEFVIVDGSRFEIIYDEDIDQYKAVDYTH